MQFIIPRTPNLRQYFSDLPAFKKIVLVSTLFFLVSGSASIAWGVYDFWSGKTSGGGLGSTLASPIGFFGKLAKTGSSTTGSNKTVASPLNGVLYTPEEAADWQSRRPMAVMINNHPLARPQTGLSQADIIYEAVAEGGITRLVAVFHAKMPEKVGPVRSARKYFVDFAKENDAWFGHWGGASTDNEANVYNYMRQIFVSSIDAMWAASEAFWRDFSRDVPTEHTGYTSVPKLYETGYRQYPDQPKALRAVNNSWLFKDDAPQSERAASSSAIFNFWDVPDFRVTWNYDKTTNSYQRHQGGQLIVDADNNQPLMAKDVVILFMNEKSVGDEKGHLLYTTTGQGNGKALLDGKVYDLTWVRKTVNDRTRFLVVGDKGDLSDLKLNRGQIWIEVLPTGAALTLN